MKETYQQMRQRHSREAGRLPLKFAFSADQLKQILKEWKGQKVIHGPSGMFYRKADRDFIHAEFDRIAKEERTFLTDPDRFYQAALYEMQNHEYGINWQGDWDVLQSLGFDADSAGPVDELTTADYCSRLLSEPQAKASKAAKSEYYRLALENEWF